jgi:pyrimidine operon attenuation protein/uracil phosphoribosyltransferase
MPDKTLILSDKQIKHKIRRIAFQILEFYDGKKQLVIAGIAENGFIFAEKLVEDISIISEVKPKLCKITMDKKHPYKTPKITLQEEDYKGQSLVLVDDVLNTGSTLIYAVKHFLETDLKELKTAVLIDRSHKKFPIKADFKGLSLSTSLNETVKITFDQSPKAELF